MTAMSTPGLKKYEFIGAESWSTGRKVRNNTEWAGTFRTDDEAIAAATTWVRETRAAITDRIFCFSVTCCVQQGKGKARWLVEVADDNETGEIFVDVFRGRTVTA